MKPENLHDSELIRYASLSDDPEKRRLAEIADGGDARTADLKDTVDDFEERWLDCRNALLDAKALDRRGRPDTDYLQYLARLSQAADAGRVQLVEDCGHCDGTGRPTLHPSPDPCLYCGGRGVILHPADSDSI